MGDIEYFCRPLPKGFHCEQAFPGFNYVNMARKTEGTWTKTVLFQGEALMGFYLKKNNKLVKQRMETWRL